MSTLFISDIHLCAQRPDMTAALVRFLAHDAPGADALYVLGDLFEFWIGDDDPNPLHGEVADAFAALSQQGCPSTSFTATATSCWARPLPSAPA